MRTSRFPGSLARALAAGPSSEAGMTVVEMLIATAILSLVTVMALTFMVQSGTVANEAIKYQDAANAIDSALGTLRTDLRLAGTSAAAALTITASPLGGAKQLIGFKKNTGFDLGTYQVIWSANPTWYYYDQSTGEILRKESATAPTSADTRVGSGGAVTAIATGIDSSFAISGGADQGQVTITIQATRLLTKGSNGDVNVTVATSEVVTIRN